MSYAPGAPAAVWSIPTKSVDAGAKWTLANAWSRADHEVQQNPRPCEVWYPKRRYPPGHEREGRWMPPALARDTHVSETTGASLDAVKSHWTKLRRAGLAEAEGRLITLLTPASVFGPESTSIDHSTQAIDSSPGTTIDDASTTLDASSTSVDGPSTTVSRNQFPPVPPTPPKPGDTRATLPPPPAPRRTSGMLATGKPRASNPRPVGAAPTESEKQAHGQDTNLNCGHSQDPSHPGLRDPGGRDSAPSANAHLAGKAQRHAALAAQRGVAQRDVKPDNRRLSPELWEVIEACGWEQQARAATWCERANESLERVSEAEQPATLRRVLEAWDASTHQGGILRPKKRELWDWRGSKWREAVLAAGRPRDNMSGGLTHVEAPPSGYVPLAEARRLDAERRAREQGAA